MAADEFLLSVTEQQVRELREDHDFLKSYVQSARQRRIVLYPSVQRVTSSSGATLIQFTLTSVDCAAHTAVGTVTDIGCDATSPTVGDEVDLVDVMSLLVGYPASLEGRTGVAMKQEQAGPYGADCVYVIWNLEKSDVNC